MWPAVDNLKLAKMVDSLMKYPKRVVSIQGTDRSYKELRSFLNVTKWLDDNVLNEYLCLFQLQNRVSYSWICSSFEFSAMERNQNMAHLVHKICSFHQLLMPVNIAKHWLVVAFYPHCRKMYVYDSLYDKNEHLEKTFRQFWTHCKSIKGYKTDLQIIYRNAPKQDDTWSCGLYAISFIKSLQTGITMPKINDELIGIRQKILFTILEREIN